VGLILHEKPDLVLVDVNMPDMDGETMVRLLGATKIDSRTVVLLFSGLPEATLKQKALSSGAHGYVRKTSRPEEFVRQVKQWLEPSPTLAGRYRGGSGEYTEAPTSALASSSPPPVSLERTADSGFSRAAQVSTPVQSLVRGVVPRRSVLFVDDDMLVLSACRRALQAEGFDVEFLLSGAKALSRILSEDAPDVIVCDVNMPGLNGIDVFLRAVQADSSFRDRFVFLTGDRLSDLVLRLTEQFPGPVLTKPIDDAELRRSVLRCVLRANAKRVEDVG
jgi:CheY-like chemotaxis protein